VWIVTADPAGTPATDAAVIKQSWAEPERFEEIFRRCFARIHQYLSGPLPTETKAGPPDLVIGVQTPTAFTALSPAVQQALFRLQAAW
jgi:hypothetical protein